MKILLVEDSATLRFATSHAIRNAGHTPVIAKSGEEALQIVEGTPVDMVIMDVEMPGLDGFETTRLIREWLGDYWIPIIFVTGRSEESSLREGIEAGGDDYLIKPVSEVILMAKIKAMERITEMRDQLNEANRELTKLSERDGLTQLYNRRTFEVKAQQQWRIAARTKEPLTILLFDIDHFKGYNDCYGHLAGDDCIKKVARTLSECMNRPGDLLARYGGEEFIALLPNTPEQGAYFVAEQVRSRVEELKLKHRAAPQRGHVTISVGGSCVNYTAGTKLVHHINSADKALYTSKQTGRNKVTMDVFNPRNNVLVLDDDSTSLALIENNLRAHSSIITVHSAEECLRLAKEKRPEVILMNIDLAGLDASEICRRLNKNPATSKIPIVLMSENREQTLDQMQVNLSASSYIVKPLDDHRLVAEISQFLS